MPTTAAPLSDLRVLDLTVARAGPTAVRQLADWGADVVRIEPPAAGDGVAATQRHGHDFQNLHRNKRAITLDLKQERGRELLLRLAEGADVLVENFRPTVKGRLRIAYEDLRPSCPRLVYASISGFGQSGPYGERAGVDQIAQGMGGLMSVTGLPGQGPVRVGTAISDLAAGLYLAFGILTALHERQRSGLGQWVHTSLLEAQIGMLDFQIARYLVEGEVAGQEGNHHPTLAPMGVFATADRPINVAAASDKHFRLLCEEIGAPELLEDRRFRHRQSRYEHRHLLIERIEHRLGTRPAAEWIERLNQRGIPCGPIYTIDQTMADPQVRHLGIATPIEHPQLGEIELVGQPVHLERTPFLRRECAPERSQHTEEILQELGVTAEEIAHLRRSRTI